MTNLFDSSDEFTGETFKNLALDAITVEEKEFVGCRFVGCTFQETIFRRCRFVDCEFRACDLRMINVADSSFRDVRFEESQVIAIDWTRAAWGKAGLLNKIGFVRCVLNYSTFVGLSLPELTLIESVARDVDFSETDLSGAKFAKTDLERSRFWNTNLTGADFSGAFNYSIDPANNTIKQARFSLPEAMALLYNLDIDLDDSSEPAGG
ncbi:MAG: pentapeptide repeat-containing protein [Anaerolineae bacterium]|nr:pentapeptide repeat-containing protein [Anaerolineae bacterium]